jgi:hypothetical protein
MNNLLKSMVIRGELKFNLPHNISLGLKINKIIGGNLTMASKENARLIEIRQNEKEIQKIAERAQKFLDEENHIVISHAQAIPTIAYAFLRETINFLNENKSAGNDIEINVMQLLDLGISHRESDDAEKEGNFTPYARAGQEFKLLVKDDDATEEE